MSVNTIKMNINGVDVVKKLERQNESLKFIAFYRQCAKFYIEVHHYIHDNICMLDYPPESLFDDFILQEDNECLLERTEDYDLEIEAIEKLKIKVIESVNRYKNKEADCVAAAFIGGYDVVTRNTLATYSQSIILKVKLHEQLRDLFDKKLKEGKINDIGEKEKKTKNTVGRCAEFHLVDEILKLNSITCHNSEENDIDNIRFTFAIRTIKHYKARKKIQQEATAIDVLNN